MNPLLQKILYTAAAGAVGSVGLLPEAAPFLPFLTLASGALLGLAHGKRPGDVTAEQVTTLKAALAKYEASR